MTSRHHVPQDDPMLARVVTATIHAMGRTPRNWIESLQQMVHATLAFRRTYYRHAAQPTPGNRFQHFWRKAGVRHSDQKDKRSGFGNTEDCSENTHLLFLHPPPKRTEACNLELGQAIEQSFVTNELSAVSKKRKPVESVARTGFTRGSRRKKTALIGGFLMSWRWT